MHHCKEATSHDFRRGVGATLTRRWGRCEGSEDKMLGSNSLGWVGVESFLARGTLRPIQRSTSSSTNFPFPTSSKPQARSPKLTSHESLTYHKTIFRKTKTKRQSRPSQAYRTLTDFCYTVTSGTASTSKPITSFIKGRKYMPRGHESFLLRPERSPG